MFLTYYLLLLLLPLRLHIALLLLAPIPLLPRLTFRAPLHLFDLRGLASQRFHNIRPIIILCNLILPSPALQLFRPVC